MDMAGTRQDGSNLQDGNMDPAIYRRRLFANRIGMLFSGFAMMVGLAGLLWILWTLVYQGVSALGWDFFTQSTPAPGSAGGGMLNAIVGSLIMVGMATAVATPIGILAGIYLAEFGARSRFAAATRFLIDIMLSAPSIVIGLFVYAVAVATVGSFSGWAGSTALSLIAIPVVARTTENMLALVPGSLREAAFALGTPRWKVNLSIALRAVKGGVVTGVLLAIARMIGETAPLLFTALSNQFFTANPAEPMASLPVVIYNFAMSPYEDWQRLAWGGALLIALIVLGINIAARVLFRDPVRN
jgi:phosphate transport system permease protein